MKKKNCFNTINELFIRSKKYDLEAMSYFEIKELVTNTENYISFIILKQLKVQMKYDNFERLAFERKNTFKGESLLKALNSLEKEIKTLKFIVNKITAYMVTINIQQVRMQKDSSSVIFQSLYDEEIDIYYEKKYKFVDPNHLRLYLKNKMNVKNTINSDSRNVIYSS